MSERREVWLHDGDGDPIDSTEGALHIHDAEIDKIPFNEHFHIHTGVATTLAVANLAGAIEIEVVSAVGLVEEDYFQIENGVIETTFPQIKVITGNVLTLDRPLDNAFSIGDTVEVVNFNMNAIGTISAPISFKVIPDLDQIWHVHGFSLSMVHTSAGDDSLFGDLTALPNGVVIRAYNATANQFRTFTVWKRNADISLDTGGVFYNDKVGGGLHGETADGAIYARSGAIPALDGATGDYMEILIQDNISALNSFLVKMQGHVEIF